MKSKYSPVLKVKKQELDKAELDLSKARQRQRENEEALQRANAEYLCINLPQKGDVMLLKQSLEFKQIAKDMKDFAEEKVRLSSQEINHYQHLYKKAHLAFEKIKYLETEEFKEYEEKMQKAEKRMLDEIAVSRYFRERKKDE